MSRHRFAVAASNAGHFSTAGSSTWVNGTDEHYFNSLLDWSSRASHVSKVAAEEVINLFYGNEAGARVKETGDKKKLGVNTVQSESRIRAYLAGCSAGGKQSFGSVTEHFDDFDGVIVGSPTLLFNRLNRGQVHTQVVHRQSSAGQGFFNITLMPGAIHQTILKQCDALDGVKDGIIVDATQCKPRFEEELLCGSPDSMFGGSSKTCMTQAQ